MLHGFDSRGGRRERPIRTGRRDKPIIQLPSIALRAAVIVGLAVVLFGIILFRLWFLQILSGAEFVAEANNNRLRPVKIVASRGSIVDRHGDILVENRPGNAVCIRLMDVPDGTLDQEVARLARVMHVKPYDIRKRIKDYLYPSTWETRKDGSRHNFYSWKKVLKKEITGVDLITIKDDIGKRLRTYLLEHAQQFPGVEIGRESLRSYPHGALAAHILGYVGDISSEELEEKHFKGYEGGDVVGQSGLEWTYDRWLRGRDGVAKVEIDAHGTPKGQAPGGRAPEPGDTLMTTLDTKVQAAAEQALVYAVQRARGSSYVSADGGAAVVLDAKNGDVLGMASYPTYNPKIFVGGLSKKDAKWLMDAHSNLPLFDRAIQETKAVGSTFKVIDAVAGLEEGVITPYTGFYCDGSFTPSEIDSRIYGKTTWNCWYPSGHGNVNLDRALTESCDVYFYNVGLKFWGRQGTELEDWAKRLGLGKTTGIDLPGEQKGRVPTPAWKREYFKAAVDQEWTAGDSINLSIGQGNLEASPLQLAVTYAAIANGGTIVTPHVGLKIVDAQGSLVRRIAPDSGRKLEISKGTLDAVRKGLYDAAHSPMGTSYGVFGGYKIPVAGKTGTAQVAGKDDYAWYASYAPADDPKYVVVVMIEQGGHGGEVAAPATRMIYDALFDIKSEEFTGDVNSD